MCGLCGLAVAWATAGWHMTRIWHCRECRLWACHLHLLIDSIQVKTCLWSKPWPVFAHYLFSQHMQLSWYWLICPETAFCGSAAGVGSCPVCHLAGPIVVPVRPCSMDCWKLNHEKKSFSVWEQQCCEKRPYLLTQTMYICDVFLIHKLNCSLVQFTNCYCEINVQCWYWNSHRVLRNDVRDRNRLTYLVNTIPADALAPKGITASAVMVWAVKDRQHVLLFQS